MHILRRFFTVPFLAAFMAGPLAAQEGFSPRAICNDILTEGSAPTRALLGAWVMGFLDGQVGQARQVDMQAIGKVLDVMTEICGANPRASLLEVVSAAVPPRESQPTHTAGSEAQARALIEAFLSPDADFVALTRALQPSEADIHAVYAPPLAANMVAVYAQVWADPKNLTIAPKPGQTEVLLWWTVTDKLIAGDPVLDKFPGGYKDVLAYMKPGFPIARFKFVKPGETTGYAFDGLIFVNDHWVLMPKPWRLLR